MTAQRPKKRHGFAAMDPEKVKAIASMGGKSVPKK
ncbi:KGG domain-containing protein [Camelimonas fluminis]|uniref:KGG domain-containing protein n=1 Tax=Camelimonas fluminis TaxID=1576911 RepID=A0ABV7UNW6_9HYPH